MNLEILKSRNGIFIEKATYLTLSQTSSSFAMQSEVIGRDLVMVNLSFNSSWSPSTMSALPLFSPRDFSRVLARLSGSGLTPSDGKTFPVWSSEDQHGSV